MKCNLSSMSESISPWLKSKDTILPTKCYASLQCVLPTRRHSQTLKSLRPGKSDHEPRFVGIMEGDGYNFLACQWQWFNSAQTKDWKSFIFCYCKFVNLNLLIEDCLGLWLTLLLYFITCHGYFYFFKKRSVSSFPVAHLPYGVKTCPTTQNASNGW